MNWIEIAVGSAISFVLAFASYFVGYYRGESDGYRLANDSRDADAKDAAEKSAHEKSRLEIYRPDAFDKDTWNGLSDDFKREIIDAVGPF